MSVTTTVGLGERSGWKREPLVEDERGRGFPAVLRYGPYVFVSGSDGHRRISDERIDPALAEDAVAQCRNAYGRVAARLEKAGYGGDCAVWIQNFTSGQHWRLERMALWPEFFGEENHQRAVSFGAQTRMSGINMLTCIVLAIDPSVPRHVAVPAPDRGRASRMTRVGPLAFVIGVRGHADPVTGAHAPEETDDAFDAQLEYALNALESHLAKDATPLENFVRLDATLRAARFVPGYERALRRRFGGRIPFASSSIGTPLGARCEQEIGGIAAAPGEERRVHWSPADPSIADAAEAGGLLFVRNVSGLEDERTGKVERALLGDLCAQVDRAVGNVEAILGRAGSRRNALLRLDVFVRDIYAETEVLDALRARLGSDLPALTIVGCEPRHGAEIELTAVAAAG